MIERQSTSVTLILASSRARLEVPQEQSANALLMPRTYQEQMAIPLKPMQKRPLKTATRLPALLALLVIFAAACTAQDYDDDDAPDFHTTAVLSLSFDNEGSVEANLSLPDSCLGREDQAGGSWSESTCAGKIAPAAAVAFSTCTCSSRSRCGKSGPR